MNYFSVQQANSDAITFNHRDRKLRPAYFDILNLIERFDVQLLKAIHRFDNHNP